MTSRTSVTSLAHKSVLKITSKEIATFRSDGTLPCTFTLARWYQKLGDTVTNTLTVAVICRAVGRGGAGGARAPPIILTGPLWNNCTIVCELAMPPENTNSQYNTITNCYKTTSWASTHAGPANWNLHLGSRFCANMFQKCRKLLLRELQFSKFSGGAYPRTPLETKLLNILYMYMPLFSNWAGPPQKILSCYGPDLNLTEHSLRLQRSYGR